MVGAAMDALGCARPRQQPRSTRQHLTNEYLRGQVFHDFFYLCERFDRALKGETILYDVASIS